MTKNLKEFKRTTRKQFSAEQLPVVVVAPTFTSIAAVESLRCECGCRNLLFTAAQNCNWEKSGAYTGEISVDMVKDAGCEYVIIGHSERRQYFNVSTTYVIVTNPNFQVLASGKTQGWKNVFS